MTFNNFSDIFNIISQDFDWESLKPSEYVNTRNDYTYNSKYNNTSLYNYNSTPVTNYVKLVCVNYKPTYSSKKVQKKYNKSFSNRYKQQNQRRTHHWK